MPEGTVSAIPLAEEDGALRVCLSIHAVVQLKELAAARGRVSPVHTDEPGAPLVEVRHELSNHVVRRRREQH